MVIVGEFSRLF